MEGVKKVVQSINSYAKMAESTFSNVNLDFVLNTNSYKGNALKESSGPEELGVKGEGVKGDVDADSSYPAGLDFIACVPCAPTGNGTTGTNSANNARGAIVADDASKRSLLTLLAQQNENSSSGHHLANEMKTHYLRIPGILECKKLEALLDSLLYNNGTGSAGTHGSALRGKTDTATASDSSLSTPKMSIFRMKGIVRTQNSETLHILQAVHNIFDLQPSPYKPGEVGDLTKGDNIFVIIGKNLDMHYIEQEIVNCLVSP
jgi:G3E family GTPase